MDTEDFLIFYKPEDDYPEIEQMGTPFSALWTAERVIYGKWDNLTKFTTPTESIVEHWVSGIINRFCPYDAHEIMEYYRKVREESRSKNS